MKRQLFTILAAAAAVTATILVSSGAAAAVPDATAASAQGGPGVTPNGKLDPLIQVDEKLYKIVASLRGVGKQVYDCNTAGIYAPRPEPIAGLFTSRGIPAGIHGQGPFWANFDGSHVAGSALSPPATVTPDPKSVPWLKLLGTPTKDTTGVFSNVAFIQRIDTRGGIAPTAKCTVPSTVAVDYTANYVFWAPNK